MYLCDAKRSKSGRWGWVEYQVLISKWLELHQGGSLFEMIFHAFSWSFYVILMFSCYPEGSDARVVLLLDMASVDVIMKQLSQLKLLTCRQHLRFWCWTWIAWVNSIWASWIYGFDTPNSLDSNSDPMPIPHLLNPLQQEPSMKRPKFLAVSGFTAPSSWAFSSSVLHLWPKWEGGCHAYALVMSPETAKWFS